MTTVAWKDGILAADSQVTQDDVKYLSADKITIINKDLVISGAGDSNECLRMERWFKSVGADWEEQIDKKPQVKKTYEAIVISKGRPYTIYRDGPPEPIAHPFYAIGSGWKFAMAAMYLGKSATEAVLLASQFDVNTNDRIRYINVKELQGSTKAVKGRPRKGSKATSLVQTQETRTGTGIAETTGTPTTTE